MSDSLGDSLIEMSLDGKLMPGVCSSWRLAPGTNNLGWEFKIRQGVRFWDGTEVTAEDVKFTLERARKAETGYEGGPFMRANIARVEVVDNETIRVFSPKPTPWVVNAVGGRGNGIIPKAYFEKVGEKAFGTVEKLLTCGEFKPVEHKRMRHFVMEANEDFYNPERVPRTKRIKLVIIPELSTRIAMLQTGEADIIDGATGTTIGLIKSDPKLHLAVSKKTASYFLTPADMYHDDPSPLKDRRVRQALAHAIDVDSIIKKIYFGEATPCLGMTIPRDIGYDKAMNPWGYNPEKAKKLLAEAGYPNGFTLDLQGALTPSTPLCDKVLEATAGYFKRVGVKTNLKMMESGMYYAKYREHAYKGLAAFSCPVSIDHLISIWYLAGSGQMYSHYSNKQFDAWLEAQKTELDPQKRAKIGTKIYNHWFDELVGIPIHHVNTIWGMGPGVKSWTPVPYSPYTVGLEYVVPAD
jgi:peptide/nickel transport system substrate-binding protein